MDERTNLSFIKVFKQLKNREANTGAAGMNEEMVEIGSIEWPWLL